MNTESEIELLKIGIQKLQKQNEFIQKQHEFIQKQNEYLQKEFNDLQKELGIIKTQNENFQKEIKETIEDLAERRKEQYYQRYLEKLFSAKHKKNKHGITDITTDTQIIEIKHWKAYKSALGQLISYKQSDSEKLLEVYFFGTYNKNKDSIIELFKQNNISVYELADTPTGIQINEIYKYNHNSLEETDDFFNWLEENIIYNEDSVVNLKDICKLYFNKDVSKREKTKCRKEIEKWISKKFTNIDSICKDSRFNGVKYNGWKGISFKTVNKT